MIRRFLSDIRGNVTITATLMLIPICLCAGAAIDYSRLMRNQGQLQNAVDAALLSVANTNPLARDQAELETEIDNFLQANMPAFNYNKIKTLTVNKVGTGGLSLDIDAEFPTSLMKIAGYETFEYGISSEIQIKEQQKFEIALVLDSTGSMSSNNKMGTLKSVANNFVSDLLKVAQNPGDMKFSVVPFAQYVNVGRSRKHRSWAQVPRGRNYRQWSGCVGSRNYPLNIQDKSFTGSNKVPVVIGGYCPKALRPLTDKKNRLSQTINGMQPSGSTYIPAGIVWGIRTLSSNNPFNQGSAYSQMDKEGLRKVIIVMTDGDNTVSKSPYNQYHSGYDRNQTNAWTLDACNEAKNSDIEMYTISFGYVSSTTKTLLENCASQSANYYDASNAAALKEAFEQIAGGLAGLYLSK